MSNNILIRDGNSQVLTVKTTDNGGVQTPHQNAQLYVNGADVSNTNLIPVDGSHVTQPISAISLPLPTGAATAALQLAHSAYFANAATTTLQTISISLETGIYNELQNLSIFGKTVSNTALTVNAVTTGGLAKMSNPIPVSDGTAVNRLHDTSGKVIAVSAIRSLKNKSHTVLTDTSAHEIIPSGGANVYRDLYRLIITNTSFSPTIVRVDDGSGTTHTYAVPPTATVGFIGDCGSAMPQAVANSAWGAYMDSGSASIEITAEWVENL